MINLLFGKWMKRIQTAEEKAEKLKQENERIEKVLDHMIEKERRRDENKGAYCKVCGNGYKKDPVYYGGIFCDEGYGCKLEIPCKNFIEKANTNN